MPGHPTGHFDFKAGERTRPVDIFFTALISAAHLSIVTSVWELGHNQRMEIRHLDFYCERLGPEFWAEPFNAWSNLGFILVGLWGIWQWRKNPAQRKALFFSLLIMVVGVGSFLFHTFADNRTHLADLIPIFVFCSCYLFYSFRHLLGMRTGLSSLLLVLFVGSMATLEFTVPKTVLNGSLLYLPPLVMLFYVGAKLKNRFYLAAATIFFVSLIFRTVDPSVCDGLPIGTHFIWHLLNSVCLGLLVKVSLQRKID